jgi:protein SCO1/2
MRKKLAERQANKQISLLGICALIIGGAVCVGLAYRAVQNAPAGFQINAGEALVGGPFELVDSAGMTVTEKILMKPINFVYFGFTHCPDFCPTELHNLAFATEELQKRDIGSQTIFITVDPKRDTPEIVGEYARYFDESFIGLSGSMEQMRRVAQAYRVYVAYGDPDIDGDYAVDHSTLVYAMNDKGRFITHFSANTDPVEIAETLQRALSE